MQLAALAGARRLTAAAPCSEASAEPCASAQDLDDIRHTISFADREQLPLVVLGGGNKTLVRDGGIRGVVLRMEGCLARADSHGEDAMVGAGMGLPTLVRQAAALGLGGIEPLVGIPGTLGGALMTNAATVDGGIGEYVSAVYFLYPDGTYNECKAEIGSTPARLDIPSNAVVVGCRLRFRHRAASEVQKDVKQRLRRKNVAQPLALASARAVWKDPPAASAERLIAQSGLRGKRVGSAEISAKQNFLHLAHLLLHPAAEVFTPPSGFEVAVMIRL